MNFVENVTRTSWRYLSKSENEWKERKSTKEADRDYRWSSPTLKISFKIHPNWTTIWNLKSNVKMSITDICQNERRKGQKYIRGRGRLSSHACNWITNQNPYIFFLHICIFLFALCVFISIDFYWEQIMYYILQLLYTTSLLYIDLFDCFLVFLVFLLDLCICVFCISSIFAWSVYLCADSGNWILFVNPCRWFDYQSELPYISMLHT